MGLMTLSPSYCYAGDWREVCVVESACCIKINLKATVWVQSFHSLQVEIVLMHFSRTNANYNYQIILILLTNLLWANSDFILILWRRKVGEDKAITQQETTSPGHSVEVWCKSKSFKINHLTWQELRWKSQKYTKQCSQFEQWLISLVSLLEFLALNVWNWIFRISHWRSHRRQKGRTPYAFFMFILYLYTLPSPSLTGSQMSFTAMTNGLIHGDIQSLCNCCY